MKDIKSWKAEWEIHEVPSGKQSADIHLSSYLGYLIGINKGKDYAYIIVSKDKDFDKVIEFWKETENVQVSRIETIKLTSEAKKTPSSKKNTPAKEETATQKAASAKEKNAAKTELEQKVLQALCQADNIDEDIDEVAKFVADCYDEKHPEVLKSNVHNKLQKKYETAQEIYCSIKSVLNEYSSPLSTAGESGVGSDKTAMNNVVQQILSKAKMSADVIGYVTSTVVKNLGVKNGKQQIYRSIISEYGQKKGLDIYNRIKKSIP